RSDVGRHQPSIGGHTSGTHASRYLAVTLLFDAPGMYFPPRVVSCGTMTTNLLRRTALLIALFSCAWSHAATFTLEQVLSSPFPSELVAAQHPSRIAWVFDAKGARNVWIADGPNFLARQVTHYSGDDGTPIASLRITPDGRTVVFVRGTETN